MTGFDLAQGSHQTALHLCATSAICLEYSPYHLKYGRWVATRTAALDATKDLTVMVTSFQALFIAGSNEQVIKLRTHPNTRGTSGTDA